ncbi:MAG: EAL domain-containing protein [Pseudomonadota bacterium]
MRAFNNMSIGHKILWICIGTSGIALLLTGGALGINDWLNGKRTLIDHLTTQANIIGINSTAALVFNDPQSATLTLSALSADTDIIAAGIYRQDKLLFASYSRTSSKQGQISPKFKEESQHFKPNSLFVIQPIILDGEQIGVVYLRASLEELYAQLRGHSGIIALVLFISLLVAIVLSSKLQRLISGPIQRLTEAANAVSKDRHHALRVSKSNNGELNILTEAFNEMLVQIQERDHRLKANKAQLEALVLHRTKELCTLNQKLEDHTQQLEALVKERTAELHNLNQQLKHQAYHDTLTGLPNRALLNDRLSQAILHAKRRGKKLAVLFLDLDRFKYINDTLGHAVGDQLLSLVAVRLGQAVRKDDTVARLGGDEFTVLLNTITHMRDAREIARKMVKSLEQPFNCYGRELHITTSIGIAVFPKHGNNTEDLMRNADIAMYCAKTQGRNNYRVYAAAMHAQSRQRLEMENNLRQAIKREDFVVYYQPQCDIHSRKVIAVEALVRWRHPQLGLIYPETFIHILEDTGMIVPVGALVLKQACIQIKTWSDAGLAPIKISVNVSPRQFNQRKLVKNVQQIIKDNGIPSGCLTLEITESLLMENVEDTINTLHELNGLGVHLAIDDFGTGYSSLYYLKHFPIDSIKIDKSFIRDIATDPNDAAIVRAIIAMAHALGKRVIAEGVETSHQLAFLRQHRCDAVQGYLFSRPLPDTELATKLVKAC